MFLIISFLIPFDNMSTVSYAKFLNCSEETSLDFLFENKRGPVSYCLKNENVDVPQLPQH